MEIGEGKKRKIVNGEEENLKWKGERLALARRSKFSDTARNPAKQRSISSAVLRSLMSVGNATDKAEWRRTYGQIPLFAKAV